ncbi:MAG: D-alanyl-D-alanine carboxypeptidase/D-alanyl-D-alanine-endopeptidase [Bacteroidetes bacterium]|nr:D-alanyl-D-alanine carboxypeptidase/D-alanyl-D-alanine-endopeptidase [Bacteroidota bacterium]
MKKIVTIVFILVLTSPFVIKPGSAKKEKKIINAFQQLSFDSLTKNDNNHVVNAIELFANETEMQNASIGFMLIDPANHILLCDYNSNKALIPASGMKLFTTASALQILNADSSFTTWIEHDGTFDAEYQILEGNIYIRGGGDPCLGSKAYKSRYYQPDFMESWAKAIKSMGVDIVEGDIIGDEMVFDTDLVPPGWNWIDIPAYYGSAASGLSIFDNTYKLEVQPAVRGIYLVPKADIAPYIPDFYVENHIDYSRNGDFNLDLIGTYYSNYRIIKGSVPQTEKEIFIKGSIPDPSYLSAIYLKNELEKLGVKINGTATTMRKIQSENNKLDEERTRITSISSPDVGAIVRRTNLLSINLYAEHLINHIGYTQKGKGSTAAGTEAMLEYWKKQGMDIRGMYAGDGCGLSRSNTLTARQLVHLLYLMRKSAVNGELFYNSLPVSGVSGTLKRFGTSSISKGKIHAKSGSMNRVKSYAGYLSCQSGNELIFAFIINAYDGKSADINKKILRVLESAIQNN